MIRHYFNWKISLFSLLCFLTLVMLGLWQLDQAGVKKRLLQADTKLRTQAGIHLDKIDAQHVQDGQPVLLQGEFDASRLFLLDNRVLHGKVGFELLIPFRDGTQQLALLNLGFLPMGRTRQDLPQIPPIATGWQQLRGYVYLGKGVIPKYNISRQSSPFIVQNAYPDSFSEVLGQPFFPYLIRLDGQEKMALPRHWPVTTILPARHYGYAVTWFAMATAVLIAFITLARQKKINGSAG